VSNVLRLEGRPHDPAHRRASLDPQVVTGGGRKRTRLTPEVRRDQILDQAARLILDEGLHAVNMERLARDAGISKGLVYNYFSTREALLTVLLNREQTELRDRGMASALRAESYEDLIRQTTRLYLEHTRDRGALIASLLSDPSVARLMEEQNRADRERTMRYFVRATRREFDLSLSRAIAAIDMLSAVTDRAGKLVAEGQIDVEIATSSPEAWPGSAAIDLSEDELRRSPNACYAPSRKAWTADRKAGKFSRLTLWPAPLISTARMLALMDTASRAMAGVIRLPRCASPCANKVGTAMRSIWSCHGVA